MCRVFLLCSNVKVNHSGLSNCLGVNNVFHTYLHIHRFETKVLWINCLLSITSSSIEKAHRLMINKLINNWHRRWLVYTDPICCCALKCPGKRRPAVRGAEGEGDQQDVWAQRNPRCLRRDLRPPQHHVQHGLHADPGELQRPLQPADDELHQGKRESDS